jgi:riboflavin synthase
MFTGLVEDVGDVTRVEALPSGEGRRLWVRARLLDEALSLGASLAVDGVCLTVTAWQKGEISADVGPETMARTTLGSLAPSARVNLERPLRLGDRLGGHMVAGHVDGVGTIVAVVERHEALDFEIHPPRQLLRYIVPKGSIAVDGISLTVNLVDESGFTVSLIPHTQQATTLANKGKSAPVNLEVDLIGKYVEKLVGGYVKS